ncbi:hypothetical protein ACFOWM_07285 [Ferruginibacter yonginensis]|uniref:Uncharacterized protein n=1 Tax=Ferruginibacter yonginensis TaxID=1310416 RepID=A0ABV8QSN3_9BACT
MQTIKETEYDVQISEATKLLLQAQVQEERQVIIHGSFKAADEDTCIRIWKTTYLIPQETPQQKSSLLLVDNITLHPQWTYVYCNETIYFTLIFEGLPKNCKAFDFVELIPEPGGFYIANIQRNATDVYYIKIA